MSLQDFIKKQKADIRNMVAEQAKDDALESSEVPDNSIDGIGSNAVNNNDAYYYNMLDPNTGYRYDIPLLSPLDPGYYFDYIYYMKLKEASPETFEKLRNWE